ncbi:MAG: AAA family ATPase [Clostridia bacterium]|nr:AAA family ATPase [Clostridia bacterium]
MNIFEAKQQISNAITAYRTKDEYGRPVIPIQRQRPIFLIGAPGIGKTAIMEQIAQEMSIPLVSYSMTHHTRQSALGLPFITEKEYQGTTFRVSEYTMSEIIAAVYDKMEKSGVNEGILFLDEINCVSETLAPAMLQFLQYKVFGQHRVPDGWIVVTAGNPPEYNQSVREFDMVTWDRLKRIDVEANYDVWHKWAVDQGVHPAITSYLDIRKGDFYQVESTVDGKTFVTPRGWVDLSDMIRLYEQHGIEVNRTLVAQYLQNEKIARQFANYYDLWQKYSSDYQVDQILSGKASSEILERAKHAAFDERISLIALLMDAVLGEIKPVMTQRSVLELAQKSLGNVRRTCLMRKGADPVTILGAEIDAQQNRLRQGQGGNMLSADQEYTLYSLIAFLQESLGKLSGQSAEKMLDSMKNDFDAASKALKKRANEGKKKLDNVFTFAETVFDPDGQEMLIIVTELTSMEATAGFISRYGCDAYFRHNKSLLFYERQLDVIQKIDELDASLDTPELPQNNDTSI